tara:strand:+ start:708 stop:1952 length:1245 start_codon:yes stop_codon:yes gene_type:complete
MTQRVFSSESVTCGHPDKVCDAVSDAIVDACLAVDPNARVAVETCIKGMQDKSVIILAGEVSLEGETPDYVAIAREAAAEIGYTSHDIGMDATTPALCDVLVYVTTQSAYINQGVDRDSVESQGAGDQGLMFGFACDETEAYDELKGRFFPLPAALSQRLSRRLRIVREENILPWARPDGKTQVTVAYNEDGSVLGVDTVVVAIQHDKHLKDQFGGSIDAELEHVRQSIIEHVVEVTIPQELLLPNYKLIVNGTGRFADPGGPYADAGLTGRKIIVDTYGGMGRHGGGAFSGKDPSKVDRSAAYAARWAAKHVVAAGLATKFEIQLAYVIGVAEPVSLMVDSFGTGVLSDEVLAERVKATFDFRPAAIARDLDLLRPIYKETSSGGHFGRPPTDSGHFPWERIDSGRVENLLQS